MDLDRPIHARPGILSALAGHDVPRGLDFATGIHLTEALDLSKCRDHFTPARYQLIQRTDNLGLGRRGGYDRCRQTRDRQAPKQGARGRVAASVRLCSRSLRSLSHRRVPPGAGCRLSPIRPVLSGNARTTPETAHCIRWKWFGSPLERNAQPASDSESAETDAGVTNGRQGSEPVRRPGAFPNVAGKEP